MVYSYLNSSSVMQASPVVAALLPFFFFPYSKLCWAMIKGCQHFNLKPWQLEVVICMFAWQCDSVISGDNAHNIHSGMTLPKSIKWDGGRGRGSPLLLQDSCVRYEVIFSPWVNWKVKKPINVHEFTFWFNIFKYWTQHQLPWTSSGSKKTPHTLLFLWILLSSHMKKVPLENVSYYWYNFLLKWLPEDTWRQSQVIEGETEIFSFSFKSMFETSPGSSIATFASVV